MASGRLAHFAFIPGRIECNFHQSIFHAFQSPDFAGRHVHEIIQERTARRGQSHGYFHDIVSGNFNPVNQAQINNVDA